MSKLKHCLRPIVSIYLLLSLAACGTGHGNRVTDPQPLPANQQLVVGKVVLTPSLGPKEQNLGKSYEEWRNLARLYTHHEAQPLKDENYASRRAIAAPMDVTFFAQQPMGKFYLMKGEIQMDLEVTFGNRASRRPAPLRGILEIPAELADKAIYIGTIRYWRDEFFGTVKVEVADEYESALREYQTKFGANAHLEKRLARVISKGL